MLTHRSGGLLSAAARSAPSFPLTVGLLVSCRSSWRGVRIGSQTALSSPHCLGPHSLGTGPALLACRRSTGTATSSSSSSQDLTCPECGKVFLWEANLTRHRAARHGFVVPSAAEARLDALIQETEALERTLTERRARVKLARRASMKHAAALTGNALESLDADPAGCTAAPHFAAAVPAGRATLTVSPEVVAHWQRSGRVLGNNVCRWVGVGMVCGPVQVGTLEGFTEEAKSPGAVPAACPRVLQFTLEVHGYRERRPAQLRLSRNRVVVRCVSASDRPHSGIMSTFSVREGDVLRVQGNYALHASYDIISKQSVEHVVVEADMVGLLDAAPDDHGPCHHHGSADASPATPARARPGHCPHTHAAASASVATRDVNTPPEKEVAEGEHEDARRPRTLFSRRRERTRKVAPARRKKKHHS